MDNTIPQNTPQDNQPQKIYYDGRNFHRKRRRGNTTVIYGLVDPRDRGIFYIGLTNNLYARFKEHLSMCGGNARKQERIQAILDAHMLPWMITLEVVDAGVSPREREVAHIQAYVQAGINLLNDEVQ